MCTYVRRRWYISRLDFEGFSRTLVVYPTFYDIWSRWCYPLLKKRINLRRGGKKKKEKDSIESICSNFVYKKEKRKKRREIFRVNSNNCMEGIIIVEEKLNIVCVKKKKNSRHVFLLSLLFSLWMLFAINRLILKAKTSLLRVFFFLTFSLSLTHSLTHSVGKNIKSAENHPGLGLIQFHHPSMFEENEERREKGL